MGATSFSPQDYIDRASIYFEKKWLLGKKKLRGTLNNGETFCRRLARMNRDMMRRTLCLSPGELTAFSCFPTERAGGSSRFTGRKEGPENPFAGGIPPTFPMKCLVHSII